MYSAKLLLRAVADGQTTRDKRRGFFFAGGEEIRLARRVFDIVINELILMRPSQSFSRFEFARFVQALVYLSVYER
jgi:hypothetical protein